MRRSRIALVSTLAAATLLVSACETLDVIPALTTITGAGACNAYFRGNNRALATTVCGAVGALVGVQLKNLLKEREQIQLAEATNTTLSTGRKQEIRTQDGNTITTELITPPPAASASKPSPTPRPRSSPSASAQTKPKPPVQTAARTPAAVQTEPPAQKQVAAAPAVEDCGTVKQTVVTQNNQRYEDTISACKKGQTWVAA
jgi:hypothetical protein